MMGITDSWTSTTETIIMDSTFANFTTTFGNSEKKIIYKTDELFQDYSMELLTFASISCIVFICVGVPGNLITILALYKSQKNRNATAIFIINLAISDLLFCCFNLPLAASTFHNRSWQHGELLCRLFPLLRYGLLAVSLLTILSITINRYVMIGHPRKYLRIYRHRYLAVMIAGTWLGSFLILVPTWHGNWGRFGLDTSIGSCTIISDQNGRSPKEFLFVIAFLIPCFCIVVCYARIFYIVRKAAIRCREPDLFNSLCRINESSPLRNMVKEINNSETSSDLSHSFIERDLILKEQNLISSMRPMLSSLKENELRFIDTSVESDCTLPTSQIPEKTIELKLDLNEKNFNENRIQTKVKTEKYIRCTKQEVVGNDDFNRNNESTIPKLKSEKIERRKKRLRNYFPMALNNNKIRKFQHTSTVNTSNASILYPGRMSSKDRHLLKMILVIFLSFVICYLPITITKLWKDVTKIHLINVSGYLLIYLTTCINPIIYVVMSSEYRKAYWNLLICKTLKKIPERKSHLIKLAKKMHH